MLERDVEEEDSEDEELDEDKLLLLAGRLLAELLVVEEGVLGRETGAGDGLGALEDEDELEVVPTDMTLYLRDSFISERFTRRPSPIIGGESSTGL